MFQPYWSIIGVHKLFLYTTVAKQYSDLLHMWKNWLDFSV